MQCLISFRDNDLLVENMRFRCFANPKLVRSPHNGCSLWWRIRNYFGLKKFEGRFINT